PPASAALQKAAAMAEQNPSIPKRYSEAFHAISEAEKVPLPKVALSDLQNRFSVHLPIIRNHIFDTLKKDGYYLRRPDAFRRAIVTLGFVIGFLMVPIGLLLAATTGTAPVPWILAAILTGIIISGFGWFMTARTITGARTL